MVEGEGIFNLKLSFKDECSYIIYNYFSYNQTNIQMVFMNSCRRQLSIDNHQFLPSYSNMQTH